MKALQNSDLGGRSRESGSLLLGDPQFSQLRKPRSTISCEPTLSQPILGLAFVLVHPGPICSSWLLPKSSEPTPDHPEFLPSLS